MSVFFLQVPWRALGSMLLLSFLVIVFVFFVLGLVHAFLFQVWLVDVEDVLLCDVVLFQRNVLFLITYFFSFIIFSFVGAARLVWGFRFHGVVCRCSRDDFRTDVCTSAVHGEFVLFLNVVFVLFIVLLCIGTMSLVRVLRGFRVPF